MSALFGWLDSPNGEKCAAPATGSVREMAGVANPFPRRSRSRGTWAEFRGLRKLFRYGCRPIGENVLNLAVEIAAGKVVARNRAGGRRVDFLVANHKALLPLDRLA